MSLTTEQKAVLPPSYFDGNGDLVGTVTTEQAQATANGILARMSDMPPAEKAVFLAMIKSPDLAPTANMSSADFNAVLDDLEAASKVLSELILSSSESNGADVLARLMVELAALQRKSALDARLEAREEAKNTALDAAGKLDDAAKEIRTGAVIALVLTIVASVVSIIMSAVSIKGAAGAASTSKEAGAAAKAGNQGLSSSLNSQAGAQSARAQSMATLGTTFSQLLQAGGKFGEAEMQAQQKETEAEGARLNALAEMIRGEGDIDKEVFQALDELIKAIINFVKERLEAEVNEMAAITRG